ncbi:MAG TPA: acyltransferase, partial [Burkholderiales bacterium]|nr:acyltransferase [Burkholderiales bacterium]
MYANVQALRAFAALWVAWYHTMQPVLNGAYGLRVNAGGLPLFHGVGEIGWMGVDVFFVISGFIMAYSTKDLDGGTRDAEKFMRKRIRRIVPLYWVLTTLVVAVAIALPDFFHTYRFDFMHALKSYFFLPAERPDGVALPPLVPGWSLNYEMYFYLVFTVAIWLGVHRRVFVFATLFVLSAVAGQLLQYGNPWSPGTMRFVITSPLLLEFLAGVLIAPIAQRTQARPWICLAL